MKNVMLRATRTFIEDLCAPEYAHNHLAVEISHPDGFTDAQELSIRVYSCEYRLLGCDTRSLKGKKSRKVRFDILSEEEWEAGLYRIYVYRNGRPVGWTLLELYSGYECWDKTEVEDFQTRPEEKYFAETFCFLPLFSWMHQEQCDSNLIRQFLETLYALDSHQLAVPHLLVSGNQARKYAARLLARHFVKADSSLQPCLPTRIAGRFPAMESPAREDGYPKSGAGGSALQRVLPTRIQPARPVRKPDGTESFFRPYLHLLRHDGQYLPTAQMQHSNEPHLYRREHHLYPRQDGNR